MRVSILAEIVGVLASHVLEEARVNLHACSLDLPLLVGRNWPRQV